MRRMYDRSEVADPNSVYTKAEADAIYATKTMVADLVYTEVDIADLLVSTEDYTMTSNNLKAWKQGRIYGVCGIISLSLAGGKSLANGTALNTAIPEAYRPNGNIIEHTEITYNGLRSFQLKTDGIITVYPTAIAGGAGAILMHIDFMYNKGE